MGKKAVKKVDAKVTEKAKVMAVIAEALAGAGYTVADGVDFGFTTGTIVVKGDKVDVQIKPITPKAGVDHYEVLATE